MPKIIIDNREIEVAPNTTVIDAAAQLGIMIPRFCYHPALGAVGACRVCAVKFIEGPLKGIQMSCKVEAQDGMVVSTTDEEAVDFRKHVIEWLMLNHPHDCPVCDEGGHCLLQDMTVSGGHGTRRYAGPKRTYEDQYLGPLVQHEMNRCIHCYRCARYYQEFAGYRDLGVMRNANRTYFGRFQDGILESPFSGNLSDICPTGVYTDKPSRFFGRRWDYQRNPSVCINCSLGCHTIASARYREVKRQEARFSEKVNGHFICDRGRYGLFYAGLKSRPRQSRHNGEAVSNDQALQAAVDNLDKIRREPGPTAIAAVGSARGSLETQTMLKHLCRSMGWRAPAFFTDPAEASKVKTAIARLEPELAVSLRELEQADFIFCVGADPINEAPMLAMAMRQAQRNGAKIVVMDPRPVRLPLDFVHLPAGVDHIDSLIGYFIKAVVDRKTAAVCSENAARFLEELPEGRKLIGGYREDLFAAAADDLKMSQRPVVICGTDIVSTRTPAMAADLALLLRAAERKAGLFYLLPGANAYGAGLLSDDEASLLNIVEAIENGEVKSLILVESDPFFCFPDRQRLTQALAKLDLLIVLDYLNSDAARKAHILIPSTTLYEADGTFVNQEGRGQMVQQAFSGGVPNVQSGGGDHPPRFYGKGIPGSNPMPAWQILSEMAEENKLQSSIYQLLADIVPEMAQIPKNKDFSDDGIPIHSGAQTDLRFMSDVSGQSEDQQVNSEKLKIVFTDLTFGTEMLASQSACLQQLEPEPGIFIHSSEASILGLIDGDFISIETESGKLEAKLKVVENMAAGVLVVPRHRKLSWQIFETGSPIIRRDQIKKVGS
ncbi:MAG: NADH-quinone oxidoreductase subunit NuoG [bacterium]|nr:NADH-quinone oxidoreductase subunit NuoG [bacterium]